jgi:prepilin-type N-terminal cleavage/methylation domain-containing protein
VCVLKKSIFPGGKRMNFNSQAKGFTLSELLVSLSVLGLIAAFAIPKVLTAVDSQATKAVGKEAISMITAAYDSLKADNNGIVGKSTSATALARKMNYVSTTPAIPPTGNAAGTVAMVLHNGGSISFTGADSFTPVTAGTEPGMMTFNVDPNGTTTTTGVGAVTVCLGYDGRLFLANDAYTAGTAPGTTSPFLANYDNAGANDGVAILPPSVVDGADTTWMKW